MGSLARFLGVVGLGAVAYLFGSWLAKPTAATGAALLVVAVVGVLVGTATFRTRRRSFLGSPPPGAGFPGVGGVLSKLGREPRRRADAPETSVIPSTAAPRAGPGPEVASSSATSPVAEEPAEPEERAKAEEPAKSGLEGGDADRSPAAASESPAEGQGGVAAVPAEDSDPEGQEAAASRWESEASPSFRQGADAGSPKPPPKRPVFGRGKAARHLRRRLGGRSSSR